MANKKISELTNLATPAGADEVPLVDSSTSDTKKATLSNVFTNIDDGTAASPSISFANDQDTGFFSANTNTELGVAVGGTERIRVDSSGQVGIGTNSITTNLKAEILRDNAVANPTLKLKEDSGGDAGLEIAVTTQSWSLGIDNNDGDKFLINADSIISGGTNIMTMTTSGDVDITNGQLSLTDTSSNNLMNIVSSNTSQAGITFGDSDDSVIGAILYDNSTETLVLRSSNNDDVITIDSSEQVGIGVTPSSTLDVNGDATISGGFLGFGSQTELTISSGAVTVTKSYHKIDTEGDAASDDLDTINGGSEGDILVITTTDNGRDVTVKETTGGGTNLHLAGDFIMNNTNDTLTLIFDGSFWKEISRSNNV